MTYFIQQVYSDGTIHHEFTCECESEEEAKAVARSEVRGAEADYLQVLTVDCELVWRTDTP